MSGFEGRGGVSRWAKPRPRGERNKTGEIASKPLAKRRKLNSSAENAGKEDYSNKPLTLADMRPPGSSMDLLIDDDDDDDELDLSLPPIPSGKKLVRSKTHLGGLERVKIKKKMEKGKGVRNANRITSYFVKR